MIHLTLRYKILLGALMLVLGVSISITAVVSVLVNRQNKTAVHDQLNKTLTVIRDVVSETSGTFSDAIQHLATTNDVGPDVKFLTDFKDGDLSLVGNSQANIRNAFVSEGLLDNLHSIRVYNTEGTMLVFFEKIGKNQYVMGMHHKEAFHYRVFKKDEPWDRLELSTVTKSVSEADIQPTWSGNMPSTIESMMTTAGNFLSLEVRVPVYAKVYNPETELPEPKQFGFVVAVKPLDQLFVERIDRIIDMEMNMFVGDRFSVGVHADYDTVNLAQVPPQAGADWKIVEQSFYFSTVSLGENNYFQGLLPIYAKGNRIGGLLVLQSDATVRQNTLQMITMIGLVAMVCVGLVAPFAWFASKKVVNPLIGVVDKLKDIAEGEGDLTTRLDVKTRDEIGQVAQWFNTFIDKIHLLIQDVNRNAGQLNSSSTTLAEISQVMAQGAAQTSERSASVSAASEEMSTSMSSVAQAMEEAIGNMGTISNATGDMSNTIADISKNTATAKEITDLVVEKTGQASDQVGELGTSADEIGKVVETITDISAQVNLLALNATIEAARAGEAGKGFAVVANEIKDLATQTAEASKDIKEKMDNIRSSTDLTVAQINEVSEVVNQVNEIVIMIAAAVEEQALTTQNISQNIAQVTEGVDQVGETISQSTAVATDIAQDIARVSRTADEMSESSANVDTRSKELSDLSEQLNAIVNKFKI